MNYVVEICGFLNFQRELNFTELQAWLGHRTFLLPVVYTAISFYALINRSASTILLKSVL